MTLDNFQLSIKRSQLKNIDTAVGLLVQNKFKKKEINKLLSAITDPLILINLNSNTA